MEFPKETGQTADQMEQMYGAATVYTSTTAFMPLSLYFPHLFFRSPLEPSRWTWDGLEVHGSSWAGYERSSLSDA